MNLRMLSLAVLLTACGSSVSTPPNDAGQIPPDVPADVTGLGDVAADAGGADVATDHGTVADAGRTDGGGTDAAVDTGASDAATLACGSTPCNPATEYCYLFSGGPARPDGGSFGSASCHPLPAACTTTRTCACVRGAEAMCITRCTDTGGGVVANCDAP